MHALAAAEASENDVDCCSALGTKLSLDLKVSSLPDLEYSSSPLELTLTPTHGASMPSGSPLGGRNPSGSLSDSEAWVADPELEDVAAGL